MKLNIVSEDPLNTLASTKFVLENAKLVEIVSKKIKPLATIVKSRIEKGLEDASTAFGTSRGIADSAQLIFIEDCVNFCFWAEKDREKWQIEYPEGNIVKGGWFALIKSFERSFGDNNDMLSAQYLSELSLKDVQNLFRSSNGVDIPLLEKRLENLQEAGKVLLEKYNGKFINLIEQSNFNAIDIVKNIYQDFSSFRDIAEFNGEKIYFLKRAQITANDLTHIYDKKITDSHLLTAFADYKLPQIFREFELTHYSKDLAEKIDNYKLLPQHSIEEIEIRAATVWCVESIRQYLKEFTSSQIDNAVWLISQDQTKVNKPYHRTYTIYY